MDAYTNLDEDLESKIYDVEDGTNKIGLIPVNNKCEFYTEEQFNDKVMMNGTLSIIHFNSRSIKCNLPKIKDYIKQIRKSFSIIAVSETWLKDGEMDEFQIDVCELYYVNRRIKKGGGVSLYINSSFKCDAVGSMTTVVDGIMEMITVEIINEKDKNVIIRCVSRSSGSCVETFTDIIMELFDRSQNNIVFLCGDVNIDLENSSSLNTKSDFINSMNSLNLFPIISKPKRITSKSATVLDNIFTKAVDGKIVSGILITDVSDHLPVFTVYKN